MWALVNNTPFAAERCWVRDKDGAEVWVVAVRGTFVIDPDGATEPAEEQGEVCMAPRYRGEPNKSSLLYDADLPHKKVATDVLLHGHARSPAGQPVTEMNVTLKVANINKTLRVIGDRVWENSIFGVRPSEPRPFSEMPITYERAFGGRDETSDDPKDHSWDPRNPVGTGFATRSSHRVGKPAPNIEDPAAPLGGWNRARPAGFGPIPGHWTPRVMYCGTYDAKWEEERLPLLPDDFDERFYQCAPPDQQVPGFLHGGEFVELHNLTPAGMLRFRLPRVTLRFASYFGPQDIRAHRGVLHTVILEPDVPRVILVWHTHLPCHTKVLKLLSTRISVVRRINVSAEDRASGMWMG
jgi:hypothetical protein